MTTTLYHGEPNGPSLTVLVALFEKAVPADLVHIDLAAGERHSLPHARQAEVAMSVEGEGPVLVVEGEPMADSVFVACYLDDVGQGASLRPADPYDRWQVMTWCRQLIERTAPAAAYLGCWAHPPPGAEGLTERIVSVDLRVRWEEIVARRFADDKLTDSKAKIVQAIDKIEARLDGRSWLVGEFSVADIESYAWLAGMVDIVPAAFASKPRTSAWMERLRARPAVARALALAKGPRPTASWAPGPEINRWG